ncbi:MAG TPA: glycosyltransferase family 9 protein [Methylotenera sp.]|nr:glycosyltransferase family 9 protein [Methylotenera sp.]
MLFFNKPKWSPHQHSVKKILFVTLSNIGDVVLTTPTLEALHQQYPEALIDIVGDSRSEILFKHCPYLGTFYRKEKRKGWRGILQLLSELRKNNYDLAVDLRSDGLLFLIKARIKFHKLSNQSSLHLHSVEKHYAALRNKTSQAIPDPKIWLSSDERQTADILLSKYRTKHILALGLGANFKGKIWPTHTFVSLARSLATHFDVVLLLGNQQDSEIAEKFMMEYPFPVINGCGRFNLLETTALLEQANYFVGNDSGLGHLASAIGTPTFTIFGVGQPCRYRPWGSNASWIQEPKNDINLIDSETVSLIIKQKINC